MAKKITHSRGPWRLEIDRKYRNHQLRDADGNCIGCFDEEIDGPRALANGRLCEAAPKMLEALRTINRTAIASNIKAIAREAIAEAEGQS